MAFQARNLVRGAMVRHTRPTVVARASAVSSTSVRASVQSTFAARSQVSRAQCTPYSHLTQSRNVSTFLHRPGTTVSRKGSRLNSLQKPAAAVQQKRFINLHEYQSKGLMAKYGVRVQRGEMAETAAQAEKVAQNLKDTNAIDLIIKAQIHAGGRGKGHFDTGYKGGVKVCQEPSEIREAAEAMLGNRLITKQTGPDGQLTKKVLVHEGIFFDRELYFAILMDRQHFGPVVVASKQGGMDIEEVAEKDPNAIFTVPVDIIEGITPAQTKELAEKLGFTGDSIADAQEQMKKLYDLFIATECTQIEINPLVQTTAATGGKVYCVDAKLNFDDNSAFRQKEIFSWRDTSMEDPREVEASKHDLNYIGLDGNIGCMVNGAGLAMATMDIIQLHGGSPANFLDVGGGANEQQVEEAFKLLQADSNVKALLVNIFGGIMKCDVIAQGIVNAAKKVGLKIPLVVRLEGTNVEKGNQILAESGIKLVTASDLDDAAQKAVAAI